MSKHTHAIRIVATLSLWLGLASYTAFAENQDAATAAPHAKVTELMNKALSEYPGKEALLITVEYPPGSVDPVHRHNAHAFVYVLEGSIVMGLKGQKEVTLNAGDVFYEGPNDVHTVGRNASKMRSAKFVVLLLKDKDAPVLTPVSP